MIAAFVPLVAGSLPTAAPTAPSRLKPISIEPTSFERATPEGCKVRPESAPSAPASTPHVQHGPPKVSVERQGEKISHIRIECSCGQVTELKCEY
jgi:hypothetical protein